MENIKAIEAGIIQKLKIFRGEDIDICYAIYQDIVQNEVCAPKLLKFFFENSDRIESTEEKECQKFFDEGEENLYQECYGKLTDGLLEQLLKRRVTVEAFYQQLWEFISMDALFPDEKAKVFALYYIWIDIRIPYFELPESIRIDKQEFEQIQEEIRPQLQNARFILASRFSRWSELAYLLVQILDSLKDVKQKAVLLGYILNTNSKRAGRMAVMSQMMEEEQDD